MSTRAEKAAAAAQRSLSRPQLRQQVQDQSEEAEKRQRRAFADFREGGGAEAARRWLDAQKDLKALTALRKRVQKLPAPGQEQARRRRTMGHTREELREMERRREQAEAEREERDAIVKEAKQRFQEEKGRLPYSHGELTYLLDEVKRERADA